MPGLPAWWARAQAEWLLSAAGKTEAPRCRRHGVLPATMAMVVAWLFPPVVAAIPMAGRRPVMVPPGWWAGRWWWLPVGPIDHRRRVIPIARATAKGGYGAAEINPDIDPGLGLVGDEGGDAAEQQRCKDVGCFHDCLRGLVLVGPVHRPPSWGTGCRRTRSLARRLACPAHCRTTFSPVVVTTKQERGLAEKVGVISRVRQMISPKGFMGRWASRKRGTWKRVCSFVMCWTVTALRL